MIFRIFVFAFIVLRYLWKLKALTAGQYNPANSQVSNNQEAHWVLCSRVKVPRWLSHHIQSLYICALFGREYTVCALLLPSFTR